MKAPRELAEELRRVQRDLEGAEYSAKSEGAKAVAGEIHDAIRKLKRVIQELGG